MANGRHKQYRATRPGLDGYTPHHCGAYEVVDLPTRQVTYRKISLDDINKNMVSLKKSEVLKIFRLNERAVRFQGKDQRDLIKSIDRLVSCGIEAENLNTYTRNLAEYISGKVYAEFGNLRQYAKELLTLRNILNITGSAHKLAASCTEMKQVCQAFSLEFRS